MLNIQRLILLLDDKYYDAFLAYLKKKRSRLSIQLVEAIRKKPDKILTVDDLTKKVYKSNAEKDKRKLVQLAHHTFLLSSYISRNYPYYLNINLTRVETEMAEGNRQRANELADMIYHLAEKVEDYNTQLNLLNFYCQQSYILENRADTIRYHEEIESVVKKISNINKIYSYLRARLHFKQKESLKAGAVEDHLSFFDQIEEGDSMTIKLLKRYAKLNTLSFLNDKRFFSKETEVELTSLAKDIQKYGYILFPFSSDIQINIEYLIMKQMIKEKDKTTLHREALTILDRWKDFKFWKGYLNFPQIFYLSIQASYYLSVYGYAYRRDFDEYLDDEIKKEVQEHIEMCEEMLGHDYWEEGFYVRFINLNIIYSCFLILTGKEGCKKVTSIIENLLISYQQISFHKIYDSLFATLITAYFSLEDYVNVAETYRRYEKLTSNQAKFDENDLLIKLYYYTSQWLVSERNHYLVKLSKLYDDMKSDKNLATTTQTTEELLEYFDINLSEVEEKE